MGKYIDGKWQIEDVNPDSDEFKRQDTTFRDSISTETSAKFKPEKDRYHLYVSYACPWAHRTLIMRELKELQNVIDVSIVHPFMGKEGWNFSSNFPHATSDKLYNLPKLGELYLKADPKYSGKVTVPVLWDKKSEVIVNNESAEIIRQMNTSFNEMTGNTLDFYPENLKNDIDEVNKYVYHNINNGVYRAGFARTQKAYEEAAEDLFAALDEIESRLSNSSYVVGEKLTEADIRLFTTLVRFDAVYYVHFKCNVKRIKDYDHLSRYLANLLGQPAFRNTTFMDHIKHHYYTSHESINPSGIIPLGPIDPTSSS